MELKKNLTKEELPIPFISINKNILPNNQNFKAQEFDFNNFNITEARLIAFNSSAGKKLMTRWKDIQDLPILSSKENILHIETNITNESSNSSDTLLLDCPTTPLIDQLIVISHLLLAINSSANVIIYLFIGR